jgi:hypothetical protein
MFYKLLGKAVFKGGKWYLGRRGPKPGLKTIAAGGGAAALMALTVFAVRRAVSGD